MKRTIKISGLFLICLILFFITACFENSKNHRDDQGPVVTEEPDKILYFSTFFQDGTGGVDGLSLPYGVTVSPDGKNVYVAGQQDNALAVFNRDTTNGNIVYSTCFKDGSGGGDGLNGARAAAVSPDGKNVYVAGFYDDALVVFNRSTTDGSLTYSSNFEDGIDGVDGLDGVISVTVSCDGRNVYLTGSEEDSLVVFNRNTTDGSLIFSAVFKDGVDGVNGLNAASGIAVSPDGKNVYVTGYTDDSLAVFNRSTTDGSLNFSTVFICGIDGVQGLNGAMNVLVSPDNQNVYVTGYYSNALAVFNRNLTDGSLTYSAVFVDEVNGIEKLDGAWNLAISPDGRYVYVTARDDNALNIFERNTSNGSLLYSSVFEDGIDNTDGLDAILGIAVSHDNNNIYVTGYDDNALAVFEWK